MRFIYMFALASYANYGTALNVTCQNYPNLVFLSFNE